jgi:hypothetical protein
MLIGIKESDGKIDYSEIDWEFITRMAIRMNKNKAKYGKHNWKLPINLEEIEQALLRHVIAILNPIPNDPETRQEHLAAIGCNAQILNFHLDESNSKQPGILD